MGKYNFDAELNRRGTDSLKWDVADTELPMWVADMDFATAPEVMQAVVDRARQGIYGYTTVPQRWYDAVGGWWSNRHGMEIPAEWLCFCTGVVPAISSMVKRLTNVGDNVLVQTPVYDIFFHSIENFGRHVLENELVYADGGYGIDFADLESKLACPLTTLMILCNPHNPVGRVWTRCELAKIGELCFKHGVTVITDEIHCDLTAPNVEYTPFLSVSAECLQVGVMCMSASKAFSTPGLQSAAVAVPNAHLRAKVTRGLNSDEVAEPNCFAIEGTVAAFTRGMDWLDELRQYLWDNRAQVCQFVRQNLPMLKVVPQQATYLMWIDCGAVTDDAEKLCKHIRKSTGLYVTAGNQYRGNGKRFMRLNVACPRSRLTDGLARLKRGVETY